MKESLEKALEVLKQGGIILYPTDTVWGIGCDATNTKAVERIFELKKRADAKAMLMLVGSEGQLQQYVKEVPDIAWQLIDAAVNPITIIYDDPVNISPALLADDGSAGFRITGEYFSKSLCQRLRRPVVSTSANISGHPAPKTFKEIDQAIIDGVDYVVEVRRDEKENPAPSNIIKVGNDSVIQVIR
ncbi:MAG: threonylcarbamoyl-AMP synthase [Muribaculaceae bacterium]|nr:threonylcarbamoyl-AMP synthase [Muribaculaceae bacterium]MDE6027323.1 threonylcarbamoyl-AMP synthase [Muribaculaceae bacterium]